MDIDNVINIKNLKGGNKIRGLICQNDFTKHGKTTWKNNTCMTFT